MLEVVHQVSGSLNTGISQLAYLLAIESIPPAAAEFLVELMDELGVNEVHKGIADVA